MGPARCQRTPRWVRFPPAPSDRPHAQFERASRRPALIWPPRKAIGADASIVSLDLDSLTADIGTATQDIATMKNDLAILSASGRPATAGATAAIAAVGKAIRQAVAKANGEIDQVNADVTHAYSVANGMATGSCSRDGPGHPPAPIRHSASK
jgi:hypothetical protein